MKKIKKETGEKAKSNSPKIFQESSPGIVAC
jgi:hypothetical protein